MGHPIGRLKSIENNFNGECFWRDGDAIFPQSEKLQIRRWKEWWYLIRPDGAAYVYIDFKQAVKWIPQTVANYLRWNKA
jgi:hypothetical protein